jgi:NAD(P)-dependent dehydrogenase (short-subunit alcohol dehydrogenase family)
MSVLSVLGWLVVLMAIGAALFARQMQEASLREVRRDFGNSSLLGKRAVVVGATAGIGEGIALRLAQANCAVTVVGRDAERGAAVVSRLRAASSDEATRSAHRFVSLDASLIGECKRFARDFVGPLDFLVLTQGVATTAGFSPTKENVDRKLALHYFGRAALALELAPRLAQSADGRLLTVLSAGVHAPFAEFDSDFDLSKGFSLRNAANAAGFYNDILVEKLHDEFPTLTVAHAAPGIVASRWGSEFPFYLRWPTRVAMLFATSLEDCGELLGAALLRPAPFQGRWHLLDRKCGAVSKTALHDAAKDAVWAKTKALLAAIPAST